MKLIFLHGPAAVGKLTVARELSRQTGIPVFHNHLVVDALLALFDFGSEPFTRLRERMWLDAFHEAAQAGVTFIFTFAPESSVQPDFVRRAVQTVEAVGGQVLFVALTCAAEDQEKRIGAESRREFRKLASVEMLRELNQKGGGRHPPLPDSGLKINTSQSEPEESARMIREFFGLPYLRTS